MAEVRTVSATEFKATCLDLLDRVGRWERVRVVAGPGMREARLPPAIAIEASWLPGEFLGDPADRLIVATARRMGAPVVTRDVRRENRGQWSKLLYNYDQSMNSFIDTRF